MSENTCSLVQYLCLMFALCKLMYKLEPNLYTFTNHLKGSSFQMPSLRQLKVSNSLSKKASILSSAHKKMRPLMSFQFLATAEPLVVPGVEFLGLFYREKKWQRGKLHISCFKKCKSEHGSIPFHVTAPPPCFSNMLRTYFHKLHVPHLSRDAKRAFVSTQAVKRGEVLEQHLKQSYSASSSPLTLCWALESRKVTQKHQRREGIQGVFNFYCSYLNKK